MVLTNEQQTIVDHIKNTSGLTMISAIAGSGKTALLSTIAKELKPKSGLYLAYNKSVAKEAKKKFPEEVQTSTTHALAYRAVVIPNKLEVGFLSYKDLPPSIRYENKILLIDTIRAFCLSASTSFKEFAKNEGLKDTLIQVGSNILKDMLDGKRACTHDFYLKYFHILLTEEALEYDNFDILMLDEAGDVNPVTLEIFKLLPATNRIMVGDPFQNIYTFNHTINCFDVMKDEGKVFPMSQSFRVNEDIAEKIEKFCRNNLNPEMDFKGVPTNKDIETRAFIARTNGSLIGKMIELNKMGIQYGLTRTAKQIFELPLIVANLRAGGFVSKPDYKFLQDDIDNYYEDEMLMQEYKTPLSYIRKIYEDDIAISVSINLIIKYGKQNIIKCYEESRKHEKRDQSYMLGTSHSMKGLEFDEVTLADDLNISVTKAVNAATKARIENNDLSELDEEYKSELNLYYVACSRARKKLYNAIHL